ncbi:MAG: autotransporter outer membrane beta-barrel domain-containing protein [Verrucomicrobiia bacterium]|jgi:hypothetical protein
MKNISRIIAAVVLSCWWLTAGAIAAEDAAKKESNSDTEVVVTPVVTYVDVTGNKSSFREHWWMKDGWSGGIDKFNFHGKVDKDTDFNVEGRALYNQRDYDIRMELVRPDFGFVRAGFSQFPKYFNDTGMYYSRFSTPSFALGDEPSLNIGKIFFDAGLTLPNMPKITIGYEHQFKDGSKSLLESGSVVQTLPAGPPYPAGSTTKKIYPAFKDIDERVDIFKLGVEHTIGGLNLGDDFYFEQYANSTYRLDDSTYTLPANTLKSVSVGEQYHHDMFSNAFHADHYVNDKVYWSLGYLFTSMGGDAGAQVDTFYGAGTTAAQRDKFFRTQLSGDPGVRLSQDSHTANINLMVGPFDGLMASVGVQAEKEDTDTSSFTYYPEIPAGSPIIGTVPANAPFAPLVPGPVRRIVTTVDKQGLEEHVGLRYTKIPYTTIYTEAKWAQEDYNDDANQQAFVSPFGGPAGAGGGFGLDLQTIRQEYTAGFATSPWARMTWTTQYRHKRIDNLTNTRYNIAGMSSYAGTLQDQEFTEDEISTKLTYRPFSKVALTLKYQLVSEDIYNTTPAQAGSGTFTATPAGTIQAFNYYANIYSASATVTPMNRLYVTGLVSYQDSKSSAFDNGAPSVATPYKGSVLSVLGYAGYALDDKTDLTAEYSYSRTDNYTENGYGTFSTQTSDYSLSYGLNNQLQGASLKLTRRISDTISVALKYGFYNYKEDYTGGINDYTAHLASAACTIRF